MPSAIGYSSARASGCSTGRGKYDCQNKITPFNGRMRIIQN